MKGCIFLIMCLINPGIHQKVPVTPLEYYFDDLNWQQTSLPFEKASFNPFKQEMLIVQITLNNHHHRPLRPGVIPWLFLEGSHPAINRPFSEHGQ